MLRVLCEWPRWLSQGMPLLGRVECDGIDQHSQARPIGTTDDLLVVQDRLALLHRTQRGKIREGQWTPLRIEDPDPMSGKKLLHRLIDMPRCSPRTDSGTVGQQQARICAKHEIDAAGERIQDLLEESQASDGLIMYDLRG